MPPGVDYSVQGVVNCLQLLGKGQTDFYKKEKTMDSNIRRNSRIDPFSPDLADIVAATAYGVLLATALVLAI